MADATDLFKAMNTSALIDAAKYGGYSPIDMNTLTTPKKRSGLGAIMDVGLPMLAAAGMPIAQIGLAGRQAWNLHKYNEQAQQQALYALQQEKLKEAGIRGDRVAGVKSVTGGIDGYQGYEALPDNIINKRRATLQAPNNNKFLGGKALEQNQYGDIDSSVMNNYADQMGAVANFQGGRSAGLGAIADGQNQSLIRNALMKMSGGPIGGGLQEGQLDTSQPGQISTGISRTGAPDYIQDGVSPFLMPTDVPTGLAGLMKGGLDDAQARGTLDQNKAELAEEIRQFDKEFPLKVKDSQTRRISAMKPSGGGGSQPSETTVMRGLASQLKLTPLQQLQLMKDPETFFAEYTAPGVGGGAPSYDPGSAAASLLTSPLDRIRSTTPFKNQSVGKIKSAGRKITGTKGTYAIPD